MKNRDEIQAAEDAIGSGVLAGQGEPVSIEGMSVEQIRRESADVLAMMEEGVSVSAGGDTKEYSDAFDKRLTEQKVKRQGICPWCMAGVSVCALDRACPSCSQQIRVEALPNWFVIHRRESQP